MPTVEPKRHWFHFSPDRFVVGLLLMVGLLWLSDRFQWSGFNHHNGWTVLIALAAVAAAALVMLLWWATGLIFPWRFQFGIRSLLVYCLAASIAVSWLAAEGKRARRQAEVVEPITNSRGTVAYDWEVDADGGPTGNSEPPEPRWIRTTLGDDFFSTVVAVNYKLVAIDYDSITDARLEYLKSLTQLRELNLAATFTTDTGLEYLKGLTQLRRLDLSGTTITDSGLEYLKTLTQLRLLSIRFTKITDIGLEHLKGLTQLQQLYLTNTYVTDAGVQRLQHSLPNCKICH